MRLLLWIIIVIIFLSIIFGGEIFSELFVFGGMVLTIKILDVITRILLK